MMDEQVREPAAWRSASPARGQHSGATGGGMVAGPGVARIGHGVATATIVERTSG